MEIKARKMRAVILQDMKLQEGNTGEEVTEDTEATEVRYDFSAYNRI